MLILCINLCFIRSGDVVLYTKVSRENVRGIVRYNSLDVELREIAMIDGRWAMQ